MPPSPPHSAVLLLLLHLSFRHAALPPPTHPDLAPLLAFKTSSDTSDNLVSWTNNVSSNPCHGFRGVTCLRNRVTGVVLEGLGLHGRFDSLTSLPKLRVLSLKHNRINGHVPDLSTLATLKLVFLSHNEVSGEFPRNLPSLFRLDLSYNNMSGEIPGSVNSLGFLLTLRLEGNRFSGSIRFLNLSNLKDFNISNNNISGEIPYSLSGFNKSAFSSNEGLCGLPLLECTQPEIPKIVSDSPTSLPSTAAVPSRKKSGGGKISTLVIAAIIIGDVLVLLLVSLLLYCYFVGDSIKKERNLLDSEKKVYPNSNASSFEKGRMVFFEGCRRFELEDLLRASAEMLGKGGLGATYKAVLDGGDSVAVKRLKEVVGGGKREFEQQMEVLGRLRHPNVVSLKAYYFAKDEKLLVYDYMGNGNLFWLLHGNRGPGRTPFNWPSRLKIASAAATGLAFIHTTTTSTTTRLTHGNIKSTNILLSTSNIASFSDIGLSAFTPPSAASRSAGYRAPELSSSHNRKPTQKSDMYSFGVLLMELLTGKCPTTADNGGSGGGALDLPGWVRSVVREEWTAEVFDLELMTYKNVQDEMVGLLDVALSCTLATPDQRPTMDYVVKMIHDIVASNMSHSTNELNIVSDSTSVVE